MSAGYKDWLKDVKPLGKAEELDLVCRAKTDDNARDIVINNFIRLVHGMSRPYIKSGVIMDDLIPEGIKGLHRAIDDFNPDKNQRFATYARWWIKHFVTQYYRSNIRGFKLSGNISNKLSKIQILCEEMEQTLGRSPTKEEIAESTGYDISYVEFLYKYVNNTVSLDRLSDDVSGENKNSSAQDTKSLSDDARDNPYERIAREDSVNRVKVCLKELPDNERLVLIYRYGLDGEDPLTLKEVSRRMKFTEEWVRQLQLKGEKKLKERIY